MIDRETPQTLPKFTFKIKNSSGIGRVHDGKNLQYNEKNIHKKISVGFNTPKMMNEQEYQKPIKGPWPVSPTPITNKYQKQMNSTGSTLLQQMPHSIIFENQKFQLGKNNFFNSGVESRNKQYPRYVRHLNAQSSERQKAGSAAAIIKPEKFILGKQSQAAISNFEREKFNHQYRKSKDNFLRNRKQVSSQATHYRQLSQRKPNQKSLLVIKHTQDQFKQFCQQSRVKKDEITPSLIKKQFIQIQNSDVLPQKQLDNDIKYLQINKGSSRKKHRNRIHYHINAANQYKFTIGQNNPEIQKVQNSLILIKPNNKSNSPQNKINKTVGKIVKANKKYRNEQISLQKSSPQLQGSRFLSLLQSQEKIIQSKSIEKLKLLESIEFKRTPSKSPGKFTSTRNLSLQCTKLQNSNIQKSAQIIKKIHKPGFFVFKNGSKDDNTNYNFDLRTKVGKIKQVLVEAGQYLEINFQLPQVLLTPPTEKDTRKELFEKMSQILKNLDLHTQIVKIKKYNNCALLVYQKKKLEGEQPQLGIINNLCIIWYYTGRIYIGGFKDLQDSLPNSEKFEIKLQQYLQKHGMGFEWFPTESVQSPQDQGYIYYGEFKENICEGYGIMRRYTKQLYIGLWSKGEKCGWGKLYNSEGQLEKNGEFYNGKLVKSII